MTTTPFNVYHTATGTYLAQFGHDGTHYTVQAADFAHPLHTFDTLEDATAFALEARGFDATDRVTDENPELLYSQTVDGVTVEVYADMSALVGGARVAVSQSQWTRPDVDAVARELIATASTPANDGPEHELAIRELQFELDEVKDAIRESRGYEDDAFMQRLYSDRRSLEQRIADLKDGAPQPVRQTAAIRMARERQAAMLDLDAEYGIPTPDFGRYS